MFTIIVVFFVASLLLGLCITQQEATDREMRFLIKYHDLFNDSTH